MYNKKKYELEAQWKHCVCSSKTITARFWRVHVCVCLYACGGVCVGVQTGTYHTRLYLCKFACAALCVRAFAHLWMRVRVRVRQ